MAVAVRRPAVAATRTAFMRPRRTSHGRFRPPFRQSISSNFGTPRSASYNLELF